MRNPRITPKERNLIKGALRRVFSRSELRRKVINDCVIKGGIDSTRKRVKTWCRCENCGRAEPKSYMQVDHRKPVIPVGTTLEGLGSWDVLVERIWCEEANLQPLCKDCHHTKTKAENKLRRKKK